MPQSTTEYTCRVNRAAISAGDDQPVNERPGDPQDDSWSRTRPRTDETRTSDSWPNTRPANAPRPDSSVVGTPGAGYSGPPVTESRRRSTGRLAAICAISGFLGAVAGGLIVAAVIDRETGGGASNDSSGTQSRSVEITSAVSQVATQARPGVVRVESVGQTSLGETDIGSGVVLDQEGHILTNAHVVLQTESLQVVLADGTIRPAVLVGHDFPFTDVAVLQISPGNLTPIPIGDSDALQLGETVVAIGNPLAEFDGSVTVGVVSGLNRARTYDGVLQDDLIQTDAAVNNGNSGGALLNLDGQLVGIPTAVLRESRSGASVEGIAFALPSNRAIAIAERIIAEGRSIERPTLELDAIDLTPSSLAQLRSLPTSEGALVISLRTAGTGARAGIQLADIIIEVGGSPVTAQRPLNNALAEFAPGESVQVVFNRNGRIIETEVVLAKRS